MRRLSNWIKKSVQDFKNTIAVAKLLIGTSTPTGDASIFIKSGGNYDTSYVFNWEPTVKPSGHSFLDLLDDGDDANLFFQLKDYYSDLGAINLDMDPTFGISLSQGNDRVTVVKEEVALQTTAEIVLKRNSTVILKTDASNNVLLPSVPTSDPTVAGALWSDSGTLKVSAG